MMEVINFVFALLGHVLASVLYLVRKLKFLTFSPSSPPPPPKAVVDRSSILERKEELKRLWEQKIMADVQPTTQEGSATKEEEEVKPVVKHSETNGVAPKIANGTVHSEESSKSSPTGTPTVNEGSIKESLNNNNNDEVRAVNLLAQMNSANAECNVEDKTEIKSESQKVEETATLKAETVIETNETEVEEVTDKVYTSTFQQTLVVTKTERVTEATESEIKVTETLHTAEETQEEFEEMERRIEAEESELHKSEKQQVEEVVIEKQRVETDSVEETTSKEEVEPEEIDVERENEDDQQLDSDSLEGGETNSKGDEFNEAVVLDTHGSEAERDLMMNGDFENDTYRPLEEFLPPRENDSIEEDIATHETAFTPSGETEEKTFDDHFVLDTRELVSPLSDSDKKDSTGKKSRIHTLGVQKTEQPYSTCTTETKIAMEIREMREREEELKVMRERQARLSPVDLKLKPQKSAPAVKAQPVIQKPVSPVGYTTSNSAKITTPGYRASSVFGHRPVSHNKDESKLNRSFSKESAVEKEIRLAKDREEELRRQKGLPPREDDSYVKPSQVKSSQARAFSSMNNAENSRLLATAKIQHEIEEQTMREMALRESGHIQTLSTERTDAKVTKLRTLETECVSPTFQNGNSPTHTNGYNNGHISPEYGYKRSTPSPTGSNYSSYSTTSRSVSNKGISMQKFIASRGKETTFSAPKNGPFIPKSEIQDTSRTLPEPGKLKRTVSVESKIQQEIMEMKLREEELKLLHSGTDKSAENGDEYDAMPRNNKESNGLSNDVESCPRRNNLIAQWEQMIQNAEGRA